MQNFMDLGKFGMNKIKFKKSATEISLHAELDY